MIEKIPDRTTERNEGEVLDRLASDASGQQYFDVEGMGTPELTGEEADRIKGIIEAVLFTMGDSVETERLAEVLELETGNDALKQIFELDMRAASTGWKLYGRNTASEWESVPVIVK